jgi:hypothetical protein
MTMLIQRSLASFLLLPVLAIACSASAAAPESVAATTGPEILLTGGTLTGQVRYRFEYVDQNGPAPVSKTAKASSVRANLGYKTGNYQGFQGYMEGQIVQHIGRESFNDTINGRTNYPVIADPDSAELNQAWVSWSGLAGAEIKAGRQSLNLDNQRFIGTVDWRQTDQTFDTAFATYSGIKDTELQYAYLWQVNRVFGNRSSVGRTGSDSHIVHLNHRWFDWLNTTAYAYLLDLDKLGSSSSQTYGLRVTGVQPLSPAWSLLYEAEWAHQRDYGNNSANYDKNYYHASPALKGHGLTARLGFEQLGGDGRNAFQTPLATLHKFNGWADKFLTTPANGLRDYYAAASYEFSGIGRWIDGTEVTAAFHGFTGVRRGEFGNETNLSIGRTFKLPEQSHLKTLSVMLKFADYEADDRPYTDTKKVWVQTAVIF